MSEVVLQNRRGLDLMFLKEGCCFYVDHSGMIRDSMAKLRERPDKRQKERDTSQGWFDSWFNKTPWMTTLMGPLLILLLLIMIVPCILSRLVAFIRERVQCSAVFSFETTVSCFKRSGAS